MVDLKELGKVSKEVPDSKPLIALATVQQRLVTRLFEKGLLDSSDFLFITTGMPDDRYSSGRVRPSHVDISGEEGKPERGSRSDSTNDDTSGGFASEPFSDTDQRISDQFYGDPKRAFGQPHPGATTWS